MSKRVNIDTTDTANTTSSSNNSDAASTTSTTNNTATSTTTNTTSSTNTAPATDTRRGAPAAIPSRRSFVRGAVGMCALVGLGGVRFLPSRTLCRPPGGQDEGHLASACIHCERCREVCPTAAIGVAHIEDGILNARTPQMDFKRGWCDFCETDPHGPRCAAVCPTGALSLEGIHTIVLGTAVLNHDWCLADKGMGCSSCFDACPYEAMSVGADRIPVVDEDACNGCGACEFACISLSAGSLTIGATDKAIVVKPREEVRS